MALAIGFFRHITQQDTLEATRNRQERKDDATGKDRQRLNYSLLTLMAFEEGDSHFKENSLLP